MASWSVLLLAALPLLFYYFWPGASVRRSTAQARAFVSYIVCIVAGTAALQLSVLLPERRLRARLNQNGYRVCTQCGYSLNSEHEGQPCPECGVSVDFAETARAWRRFFYLRDAEH